MARVFMINSVTREQYTSYQQSVNVSRPNAIQLVEVRDATMDTPPAFDPATERLEVQFVDDDNALTRTFSKVVVPLTQAEIDDNTIVQSDETERQQLKQFWIDNLQGDPTNNAQVGQQLIALKRVVKYLAKNDLR